MIVYLLKSACCLAFLLAFYHLVLEREKMHQFNRFYLLGSVLFSFVAPLCIITTPVTTEVINAPLTYSEPVVFNNQNITIEKPIDYWKITLGISIFISLILSIRFGINLFKIFKKVRTNAKLNVEKAVLVLVEDTISPHTFWNYIFINKDEYNSHKIEDELFTHELTHVTQKHTFDVLLIEVFKIVFWFNPLFYFLKKSIQLNHEFIADEKVINSCNNISEYQYLLLNKAAWNNDYYLASNLNYSLTKKRLVMMTTKTSKVNNWLKKLAVIPLLTGSIYVFAERVEKFEKVNNNEFLDTEITKQDLSNEQNSGAKKILKEANSLKMSSTEEKDTFNINSHKGEKTNVWEVKDSVPIIGRFINRKKGTFSYTTMDGKTITKKISELTEEEKKLIPPPPPPLRLTKKPLSKTLFEKLKNSKKYAIWIDGKVAKNEVLNNYKNTDFYNYTESFVHKNARSKRFPQEYQYQLNTKKHIVKIKEQLPPPPPPRKELNEVKRAKKTKAPKPVKVEVIEAPSKLKKKALPPPPKSGSPQVKKDWVVDDEVQKIDISNKSNEELNAFDIINHDKTLNNYTIKRYFLNNREVSEQRIKKINYLNLETTSIKKINEKEINIFITTKK